MLLRFNDKDPDVKKAAFVAPTATLVGDVTIGEGSSVWFGAVIRGDSERIAIGAESNIQDNAVLHADPGMPLTVGDRVTVGHSAVLHGCTIGNDSIVGMGAVILNKATIGENSIVGAGALVSENAQFPPNSLIVGNPAVLKKELKSLHKDRIREAARHYVEYGRKMELAIRAPGSSE
jgi:carbonic anhydrase/acetyltransferase-like protein (isoleucine patch superfamily)